MHMCVCRLQDRLVDFETRMLRRIDYLQEVDTKRDLRLRRMAAWSNSSIC